MSKIKLRLLTLLTILLLLTDMVTTAEASPIPVDFDKNSVQFVFTKIPNSTNFAPMGTCFSVDVGTKHRPKNTFRWILAHTYILPLMLLGKSSMDFRVRYIVSAKHVFFDENGNLRPDMYIRLETQTNSVQYFSINMDVTNGFERIITHKDKSVDIAVLAPADAYVMLHSVSNVMAAKMDAPIQAKMSYLDSRLIIDTNKFQKLNIRTGDAMFFIGLFVPFYGNNANLPICRFGHVSMLPDEPVPWGNEGPQRLIFMETGAYGGNSGSPAFFSYDENFGARRLQELKEKQPLFTLSQNSKIYFAGVVKGCFQNLSDIVPVNTGTKPVALENNGIAVVVPGTYLYEMLFSKEEIEHREELFKLFGAKGYR